MTTPKLRFKEFDESWSQVILNDLAEVERGKFSVRPRNDPRYFGGKMPFVQTGDVTGSDVYLKGFSQTLNEHGIKVSKVFPENTILITIAANIGDTTITQYPVACPDSVVAIQPKKELTNTIFLKNIIDLQKDFLDSQATQNAQKNINLQVLKPLELIVPKLEEQTKIASFLSAVDEKIAQLTKKHELLSQYKQGMMQKLFSQQIRFKADDGSEFGEWEEIKLGDIASKVGSGSTPRGGAEAYTEDGIIFIRSQNVNNNQLLLDDVVYIPEQTHKKMSGSKVVANDILLNITGASIGRSCVVPMNFTEANVNQHVCIIRTPNDNPRFIQSFLASKDGQNLIDSHQTGSGREGLNFQSIRSFTLNRPCLEEQTQIANFLSAIDQKIEVVVKQIEQAKQWKKGLLQQMFV